MLAFSVSLLRSAIVGAASLLLVAPVLAQDVLAQDAEIAVADQKIESGNIVKVEKATIPAEGFLVIHNPGDDTAAPGKPIGHALLTPGSNTNVSVKLESDVKAGQKLVAVLHEDTAKSGMFDADTTKPLAKPDGKAVMAEFVAK